jgi:Ca2+ transporting ATPase
MESIKEALDNRILLALAIAAFFVVVAGMANDWMWGWVEGVTIYFAIFIIVAFSAGNDWIKDKQFVKLQSHVKDEDMPVIRGKYGATQSINVYKLVVGDIVLLETGSRIPADCVLLEG